MSNARRINRGAPIIPITSCAPSDSGFRTPEPETESGGDGGSDDSTASDLTLPDLRALFEPAGDPDCEQCEGAGVVPCMVCGGTGVFTMTMMDTVSTTTCRMCKGKKYMPCPSCRSEVYSSVLWWDLIPSKEDDPEEKWRDGPDGEVRFRWNDNPAENR